MAARNRACNTLALLLLGIVTSNASSIAADIGTGASDGPCAAEEAACPEGSVCMDCFDYLEPAASCPNTSSEDSTCEEMEESICCFASSSADCLSDDAFMNWLECGAGGSSCDFDGICSELHEAENNEEQSCDHQACGADDVCNDCYSNYVMPDECENPTTDTAINALTCDDVEEIYCCQLRASPTCLNSELFVATMECSANNNYDCDITGLCSEYIDEESEEDDEDDDFSGATSSFAGGFVPAFGSAAAVVAGYLVDSALS